jgi:hypothetical protein
VVRSARRAPPARCEDKESTIKVRGSRLRSEGLGFKT